MRNPLQRIIEEIVDRYEKHQIIQLALNYIHGGLCAQENNRNFSLFVITKGKDGQLRFTFFVSEKKNTMSSVTSRKLVGRRRTE